MVCWITLYIYIYIYIYIHTYTYHFYVYVYTEIVVYVVYYLFKSVSILFYKCELFTINYDSFDVYLNLRWLMVICLTACITYTICVSFVCLWSWLLAWWTLFFQRNARQSYTQGAVTVPSCKTVRLLYLAAGWRFTLQPVLWDGALLPPARFAPIRYTRPWVYKFAVDIDLANAAKMLRTSCYAWAPDARPLIFTWRRFGLTWWREFWGHMAAVWATTHKVCVENGLRILEHSRRDDDRDPKDSFFEIWAMFYASGCL